ncbi:NADH-quinone oxidoreductase subunit M [Cyanobacterium sp. uoEpiScrs1]|uniref:NADH-quinone oxidoreductase subunit M n=1 Tax=Cyanobacterium sp. uoEpiScrs1 TaxID=2976343 RepID=UPI0022698E21|nr:NADH-quinone oxidoreductase subunit M [Cyanobacterium sp. uoEpiScrs1]
MLSALIWIPLVGAILIALYPGKLNSIHCRLLAIVIASIPFIINIVLGFNFDPTNPNIQFTEYVPWIKKIGLNYHLGVDGLSYPLIFLNSLLTLISIYASSQTIKRSRFYYILILILNSGVMGALIAQDVLLFFLFFELEIIPLYFLIGIWGGAKRGYASMKFLLYTTVSGILILTSFLGLVWLSKSYNFDYEALRTHTLPLSTQLILLTPLVIGLGIKIPIFPFHTWLPDAHVQASTPISVLLAGILLKLGTYGLLRFGIGLFVDAWVFIAPWLATLAAISVLYGASCAILQKDMKRVIAYSSIAHMGYILLAAAAATRLSITAATFQMVSHGLISSLLFLLVGVVYKKTGSRDVDFLQGLLNPQRGLPITGSLMVLAVMASMGIPGMAGFIAEFLVFRGSFSIFPIQTLLCLIGSGLTAVYFSLMVNRVFFGRLTSELAQLPRVLWTERIPAFILSFCILVLGLQPSWMIRWNETQAGFLLKGKPDIAVVMQQWQMERQWKKKIETFRVID